MLHEPGMLQYNLKTGSRVAVQRLCCSKEASEHIGPQTEEAGVVSGGERLYIRTMGEDDVYQRVNFWGDFREEDSC